MDKENELSVALEKAKKISKNTCSVMFVIKSIDKETDDEVYYIDDNGLIRSWELLIATFDNGIRIDQ
ncbi:hypothetical protein C1631_022820 [Chryseobacterium phosphatilyticum]|uniref:Uncharacterized protein n=1 Tax=Chryseobacterium phosphatilyticum TaxID=475075 RepID=A0A316WLW1_9FLAO|nr:hypothetical protein [Chryseobacterium phosphatilyticum]PWN62401.1 hypothetical protein C1631_022820 [Chryseobacterium phosphatilyticum]